MPVTRGRAIESVGERVASVAETRIGAVGDLRSNACCSSYSAYPHVAALSNVAADSATGAPLGPRTTQRHPPSGWRTGPAAVGGAVTTWCAARAQAARSG